jgi:predicted nucleic acid-binding protein
VSTLVDTNVIIDFLKRRSEAIAFINTLRGKPAVSVASVMELYSWALSRTEETKIERLLAGSQLLPVSTEIARAAGQHVKHYRRSHGLDDLDALIAATAEHHGLALATRNVKHFPMFPKLKAPY